LNHDTVPIFQFLIIEKTYVC